MKKITLPILSCILFLCSCGHGKQSTVCNPMDLSYRFAIDNDVSRREAADPTVVLHKGTYYLFASKTGGYWYSDDLKDWTLVLTDNIPTECYAPTAISMRDTVFFLASEDRRIYQSGDPQSGQWITNGKQIDKSVTDPCLFRDDDNRLYLYWGCSDKEPLYGVELDTLTFNFKGQIKSLVHATPQKLGWEVSGDYNTLDGMDPWIEGAWINKIEGTYYLQYSSPGTQFKSYSDAVYISENPLGPYSLAEHNPFAYKPEGYACGAGHGSTFEDKYGNLWHTGTVTVSMKHWFERRLALYPVFLDDERTLFANTRFGDYPMYIPDKKIKDPDELFPQWMLLSYRKNIEVSSEAEGHPAENAADEDIRTYWSALNKESGEWAMLDLGEYYKVHALQINFAEHGTYIQGRIKGISHKFVVECSMDKHKWDIIWDESFSQEDNTHVYKELANPIFTRYLRVRNIEVPDGTFALSDFRVFGIGDGRAPKKVSGFAVSRNTQDPREVTLSWDECKYATGYNIRYGTDKDRLYHNYMVYSDTTVTIHSLNKEKEYYFAIEAFNENGISELSDILP